MAMIDLAQYSEQKRLSPSAALHSGRRFQRSLSGAAWKLKKAGLVVSIRGAAGGYRLARPAAGISVGRCPCAHWRDVRAVICTAQTEEGCEGEELCVTKYVWQRINESIEKTVDEMMLDQLVAESRKAQEKAKNHDVDYSRNSCSG